MIKKPAVSKLGLASRLNMGLDKLTPQELASMLGSINPEDLAGLSHSLLYGARGHAKPEDQKKIAKYEHRAFARESVAENPLMAASLTAAIPAYQIYKLMNSQSRSGFDPSQVLESFVGVGEGLQQAFFPSNK